MGNPLSLDLRSRLVAAVSGGMSRRRAAERFGVSAASAVRWTAAVKTTGSVEAKPQAGDTRSHRAEAFSGVTPSRAEGRERSSRQNVWTRGNSLTSIPIHFANRLDMLSTTSHKAQSTWRHETSEKVRLASIGAIDQVTDALGRDLHVNSWVYPFHFTKDYSWNI